VIDQRTKQANGSQNVIYLHGDHIDSASVVTGSNGAVVSQQQFDPWGNLRTNLYGGSTIGQTDVNYTGQVKDGSGLLYYHARYYDPFVSRFVSPDTIVEKKGDPQTRNRYSYVQNNPLNHTDPTGHCAEVISCTAEGGLVGTVVCGPACGLAGAILGGVVSAVVIITVYEVTTNNDSSSNNSSSSGGDAGGGGSSWTTGDAAGGDTNWGDSSKPTNTDPGNVGNDICSFSPDTQVATGANQEKAIGDLKVGDKVLAYDQSSGAVGNYPVVAVLVHPDPAIEYLTIDGEQLTTTPEHPFYTQEQGWTPAGQLWQGSHIKKADGSFGTVQTFKVVQQQQTMYNLTVAYAHTFFVGNKRWLVHNTCPQKAQDVADYAGDNGGAAQPGYKGNSTFRNDGRGGGQVLPSVDSDGNPVGYKEYDTDPYTPGTGRNAERVVIGYDSNGNPVSSYYTDDHYQTFQPMP